MIHLNAFETVKIDFTGIGIWIIQITVRTTGRQTMMNNGSEDSETPKQQGVSTAQNISGLIRPIQQSKKNVVKALMTVNIMETRWNKWNQEKVGQNASMYYHQVHYVV
jgi:hypothetical protein